MEVTRTCPVCNCDVQIEVDPDIFLLGRLIRCKDCRDAGKGFPMVTGLKTPNTNVLGRKTSGTNSQEDQEAETPYQI